ncbi:hypothetical protein [Actinokineospora fastidiosa]|uniref:Esterase-like activity of phytase family protein n=1 Tax=Actinokineospora fastidiosa TaxID=1816 RepID=A0A918GQU7_9PSEU|nr:hypothetical protein [Actinokineospora fastidiosa]GGS51069.1 hypothetical protein GCM10010171_52880 [Actinokineospora fastidiosa]
MRVVLTLALMGALSVLGAPGAAAQEDQCALTDDRLAEVSGVAADGEHWYVVNDGGRASTVYVLDRDCTVADVITGPTDPYDVEDLARAADGTLWLSDTGDNDKDRKTVALISLTPGGKSTVHRVTYPDGPKDSEALLLSRDGVPHLVTKNPFGTADIYRPAKKLTSPGPTALEHVGSLTLRPTDTQGGPVPASVGSVLVTGGAVSPDGTVVALRTYTDAYLYAAPDGDILAALKREPVRVPLPNEPQGEAIAIEPDGTLVSMSEGEGSTVRTVSGVTVTAEEAPPTTEATPEPEPGQTAAPVVEDDGLATIPAIGVTAVAVGALLLFMHRRATRKRA